MRDAKSVFGPFGAESEIKIDLAKRDSFLVQNSTIGTEDLLL